ncbi:MAG: TIGR00153 family protein [Candidatus Fischerbacteria bacterium RBG_13_37_8]|uniref:TIGR00153 family protein n=1 Tax=Candidatus Fischerbacteria bacterium RBG_13_37_8 TaxID=1817863 RepID=A0A1F5V8L2_9BACT|nr:MAG: TIGR00153 family protein [Candidatus Fischerbacteria bacterium RBG_13_37_8]
MRTIAKLFGKSPFVPLQELMVKIASCVSLLPALFDAFIAGNQDKIAELSEEISFREHEADMIKTTIRSHLPSAMLMPVDRRDLLEVISNMDAISDLAEDIGVLLTLKQLTLPDELKSIFLSYLQLSMEAIDKLTVLFKELDELLQASFGGPEAQKINTMIDEISYLEHKADIEGRQLARKLFMLDEKMKAVDVFLFFKIFNKIGDVSNFSEKVANRIRIWLIIQ